MDGCASNEDINHLVLQWLSYVMVLPAFIIDHLHQFGLLRWSSKYHHSTMHLIWLSCV